MSGRLDDSEGQRTIPNKILGGRAAEGGQSCELTWMKKANKLNSCTIMRQMMEARSRTLDELRFAFQLVLA